MKTLTENPNTIDKAQSYLSEAVIEKFHGDTYSCFNYNDDFEDDYIYIDYSEGVFKIESTSLTLSEEQLDQIYRMLVDFTTKDDSEDYETPFHPYNHAI